MQAGNAFKIAGMLSSIVGLLHVVIIFSGPGAYVYFGAGQDMADGDAAGSWVPDLLTFGIALVFFVFAAYAFSAAGVLRALPAAKWVLICIASLFLVRGSVVVVELMGYLNEAVIPFRNLVFSTFSLVTGIFYARGVRQVYFQ